MFLLSALSAESKKETNSLRSLRLSGDYKLSNYNTIPYLRIRVLSQNLNCWFLIDRGYSFVILNNIKSFDLEMVISKAIHKLSH